MVALSRCFLTGLLFALLIFLLSQPIHVEVATRSTPQLTVDGESRPLQRRAELAQQRLTVTNASVDSQRAKVRLSPPVDSYGNLFPLIESRGFSYDAVGRIYISTEPNSVIVFGGGAREVSFGCLTDPAGGIARVAVAENGDERSVEEFSLLGRDGGWFEVKQSSLSARYLLSIPMRFGSRSLSVSGIDTDGVVSVKVGGDVARVLHPTSGKVVFSLRWADVLPEMVRHFLNGISILAICACFLLLSYQVSVAFYPLERGTESLGEECRRSIFGFFAIIMLVGFLAYLLPANTYRYVVLAGLGWSCFRSRLAIPGVLIRSMAYALPGIIAGFWPIFLYGKRFLGLYQTDIFEYGTLVTLLRSESLFSLHNTVEALNSGPVTSGAGFIWRSIDSVVACAFAAMSWSDAPTGFVLGALSIFAMFCVGIIYLCDFLQLPKGQRNLAVLSVSCSPLILSLYLEGYFSHYYFVCGAPVFTAVACSVVSKLRKGEWPSLASLEIQCLILVTAFCVAIYPYFFVISCAAVAVVVLFETRRFCAGQWVWIVGFCGLTALYSNFQLLTLLGYGATNQYHDALDAIARHTLIGSTTTRELLDMALGLRPYHLRSDFFTLELPEFYRLPTFFHYFVFMGSSPSTFIRGFYLLALGVGVGLLVSRAVLDWRARIVAAQMLAWCCFVTWYVVADRPYIYLKSGWTLGALLPFFLLVTLASGTRWMRHFASGSMVVLLMFWFGNVVAAKHKWLLNLEGNAASKTHIGIVPDLQRLEAVARNSSEPISSVQIAPGAENLRGTDRDRVLFGHARMLFRDFEIPCHNCLGIWIPERLDCSRRGFYGLLIGAGDLSLCSKNRELSGQNFTLYKIE